MSLPSASVRAPPERSSASEASSSRRQTVSRRWFGSSMPMTLRPGMTATRAEMALIERAMSSASAMTRALFVPGAGSSS